MHPVTQAFLVPSTKHALRRGLFWPIWLLVLNTTALNLVLAVLTGCLMRFGLLSLMGGLIITSVMSKANLTWDFQQWYAGSKLAALVELMNGTPLLFEWWGFFDRAKTGIRTGG